MNKILVVGSTNTDMVVKTQRFPEPGETIIGGDFFMFSGGKGANQAVAAARLGGAVVFLTRVGSDLFGERAIKGYEEEGIDTSMIIKDLHHPSGVALITVNAAGENEIVVASGANTHLGRADIDATASIIDSVDIILCQLEVPLDSIAHLIELARSKKKPVILNPAPAQDIPDTVLRDLFCITPNETEVEILTQVKVDSSDAADRAASVLLDKGVQNVIITLGPKGSFYKSLHDSFLIKATKVDAVDTTAAGDVYNGALAVAIAEGKDWADAIQFASSASAISVTRMGAQASAPYLRELS